MHGSYLRKYPVPLRIARAYCREGRTTFGLIPDCLASRVPGTLMEIEEAVATFESSTTLSEAADAVRPVEISVVTGEPITLEAQTRWLRRRVKWVTATLLTVVGLLPERFMGVAPTVTAFRSHLQSDSVLVSLREICAQRLEYLPCPVGLAPRSARGKTSEDMAQQSMCPALPP
jgi:hypothetical protein